MKYILIYIANVAQLAGIFGMIYVRTHCKAAKISTKPRAANTAVSQWTTEPFTHWLQGPPKLPCFILQVPFFSPALLKEYSTEWHWFLLLAVL